MAKDKDKESKTKDIEVALKNLKGFSQKASAAERVTFVPTGHLSLDLAIAHGVSPENTTFDMSDLDVNNFGGFPRGKLVELFGTEGSGKSSLAYRVVGMAQKMGLKCVWIDTEQSYAPDLAKINGVDEDNLELSKLMDLDDPDHIISAEEVFDQIANCCKTGAQVIVLDSVANLVTQAELENNLSDGGVGLAALAALLSRAVKRIVQYAAKYNVLIIFINQIREKIGVMFGNPETTPGGRTLKFLSSVRIRLQKQMGKDGAIHNEDAEGNQNLLGGYTYVNIVKNRFSKPVEGSVKIPVYYEPYFPDAEEVIFDTAKTLKLVRPRVGVFSWGDLKVKGRTEFIAELKKQNLVSQMLEEVKAKAKEEKFILPIEVVNYKASTPTADQIKDDNGETKQVSRRRKTKDSAGGAE